MPEGHTIHRAARLDGRKLTGVEAHGKHLFYRWEGGDALHVHLGLFGKIRVWDQDPPSPSEGTRLRWSEPSGTLHLSGPTACEIVDPDEEADIRARLGPDPLAARDGDADRFREGLARRRAPVAQVLLDQKLVAGVGNVYRAEMLFLAGVDPHRPANEIGDDEAGRLWELAVELLAVGERVGRIVTVDPDEAGYRRPRDVPRAERLHVYHRDGSPCRRCGAGIRRADLAGRSLWWCPQCQAA